MIRVDGLVEGFVSAEDDGGEQRMAAEYEVDDAGTGAASMDIWFAMFVSNGIKKIEGAETGTERVRRGEIVITVAGQDNAVALLVNVL